MVRGGDAAHIARVLRLREGDGLTLCDGEGNDYDAEITSVASGVVEARILSSRPSEGEPELRLTVCFALPKGDKAELIIQKCVELGASRFIPFTSKFCVSRPDARSAASKTERWRKIAEEAAKQCGRGRIPEVAELTTFEGLFDRLEGINTALLYERARDYSLRDFLRTAVWHNVSALAVVTGSEGGFSPEEAEYASAHGAVQVTLGKRILRCETAPIAAAAAAMYESGGLG